MYVGLFLLSSYFLFCSGLDTTSHVTHVFLFWLLPQLSQAYKERCIIAQDGYVCLHSLNFWVSLIQFLFLALLVPLVYAVKYYSRHLSFYPLDGLKHNAIDGLICCLTPYNMKADDVYPEDDVKCDFALLFEIGYVISALLLGFCLQLIMTTSGKMYHRVPIVVGFCISFTAMVLYAEFVPEVGVSMCATMAEFGSCCFAASYIFLSYFLMLLLYPSLMHRCQYEVSTHLL